MKDSTFVSLLRSTSRRIQVTPGLTFTIDKTTLLVIINTMINKLDGHTPKITTTGSNVIPFKRDNLIHLPNREVNPNDAG